MPTARIAIVDYMRACKRPASLPRIAPQEVPMRCKPLITAGAVVLASAILPGAGLALAQAQVTDQDLSKIENVVIIYAENRSFDHLFGFFPGANGIAQATPEQKTQLDHDGTPLPYLTVFDHGK